jgi:hypothetical protein
MLRIRRKTRKRPGALPRVAAGAFLFLALVTLVSYGAVSRYLQRADAIHQDAARHVNFAPPGVPASHGSLRRP